MQYIIYNKNNQATVTSIKTWLIGLKYNIFKAEINVKRPLKLSLKMARYFVKTNTATNKYKIKPI